MVSDTVDKLAICLRDTAAMKEDEANSLLQYLSMVKPAKLPNARELSADSSMILQAISDLQKRLLTLPNSKNEEIFLLPNGNAVSVGDTLMYRDTDRLREYGHVVSINKGVMFLESSGRIKRIDKIHPDLEKLTNLPF